jgi:hypothetical protein
MAKNAADIRIAVNGRVLTAPLGSAAPAEVADAWPVAWTDHGYCTPDGVKLSPKPANYQVKAWQSQSPLRSRITERPMEAQFVLLQSGGLNKILAFGGGSWAAVAGHAGVSQFTPPIPGVDDRRMLGLEIVDGIIIERYIFPDTVVVAVATIELKAIQEIRYDLTMELNGDLYSIISSDPACQAGALAA